MAEPNIHEPAEGESAIPGFLENLDRTTTIEGGAHESSPPRRSAEEERLYDEVGQRPDTEAVPLTDEELEERAAEAEKEAAKAKKK